MVGFITGTLLEENNAFCTPCHTALENTYVDRANTVKANASALVAGLATSHFHLAATKGESTNCINGVDD